VPANQPTVVVAGHICLDVIPTIASQAGGLTNLLKPGSLVEAGPAVMSTGGTVANAGLALHRLGVRTRLLGKVGDDLFGDAILRILKGYDPALVNGMLVTAEAPTSYTLVISPPGVDRVFLHCPGANDTFGSADVPYNELDGVRIFHFGYPPLMRRMYQDGGAELESMLRRVRERGVITSLDMAKPDPGADAGRAPWRSLLERTLPLVDLFLPSLDETLFMLDRERFDELEQRSDGAGVLSRCDGTLLSGVADELLAMNAAVVALKLGEHGLYVRTSNSSDRLAALRTSTGEAFSTWVGRELLSACFEVEAVGTTGCGDCTIAGFLAGLLHGSPLDQAMTAAVALGACNVEQADAVSGVPTWEAVQKRIASGWRRRLTELPLPGWKWSPSGTIAHGPNDRTADG
jgi:sugar/nucleoside kinase (ribokinase family)